ncbi:serine hydrolase [Tamlana sp. 2_MG-2023]|uniref:serine hydrolase domain-containing protein n=1 Tax=unclassified Tamlana TaxID=2614803 RepID=UPI0026E16454|nr:MULTISPECIES: serine hydrolase [unclassified Tamlana]MDO6759811.1 serine hydrolase [Tamlana sp. 2_MG-2023]MDO6791434.1 serine hydrolase [Tamlana sp. 1_MG-2023]
MKFIKIILKGFILIIIAAIVLLYIFDYSYILRGAKIVYFTGHKTAFIDDYPYFDNDTIKKGNNTSPWPIHKNYNHTTPTEKLSEVNKDWGTVAFLIIKNDSIWYENYHEDFNKNSKTNSFSMAKSITTALLGKAIMEGDIKSLDQPVSDYYPQYANTNVTVGDLASMASGLDWVESYTSPFSVTARANYDDDLAETILNQKVVEAPGKAFKYLSGNTELLGMVIEKATGQTLSNYLSESFWQRMGATDDALWQVDDSEHRLAKAFCCISSNARDFARFGKLYKDYGKWEGKQLLDSAYVVKSITPRFKEGPEYGYGWWLKEQNNKDFFMMRGHLGQYVIVQPEDNVIIVRLGHRKSPDDGKTEAVFTNDIVTYIDEAYKMLVHD